MTSLFELDQVQKMIESQNRMMELDIPMIRLKQAAMLAKHDPDHPACRLLQQNQVVERESGFLKCKVEMSEDFDEPLEYMK